MTDTPITEALRNCRRLYIEMNNCRGKSLTEKDLDKFIGTLETIQDNLYNLVNELVV